MGTVTTLPARDEALERLMIEGDLGTMPPELRVRYYHALCQSLGLNPLTQPFEYIRLNGKLKLYAKKDATEQLRKLHGVSVSGMETQLIGEVYVVRATFTDRSGRTDQATGAVPVKGLTGDNLANAYLKAETKCKRRGTLSICGLGMLDETEIEAIPGAKVPEPGFGPAPRKDPLAIAVAPPEVSADPTDFVPLLEQSIAEAQAHRAGLARHSDGRMVVDEKLREVIVPQSEPERVTVTIKGREYHTLGIEADALVSVWNLGKLLDKREGKGSAKGLMRSVVGKDSTEDLTAEDGARVLAALREQIGSDA